MKEKDVGYYLLGVLIMVFAVFYLAGVSYNASISIVVVLYLFTIGLFMIALGVFIEVPIEKPMIFSGEIVLGVSIILSGVLGYLKTEYVVGGLLALAGALVISYAYYTKKTYS